MPPVSLSFLLTIAAIAIASGAYGFVNPNPVYGVTAVVLALYAVHGLGLRFLQRERGEEIQKQVDSLQAELERETAAHEAERAEHSAMEREWIGLASRSRQA